MYAEIKSNSKMLINRLDDSEKILLEEIFNKSQEENKELKLEKLLDENGDFGGVFLKLEEKEVEESIEAPTEE